MKSIPKSLETVCSDLKPRDLHFRPECDDTQLKCGAHKSWVEGFDAGVEAILQSAELQSLINYVEQDCINPIKQAGSHAEHIERLVNEPKCKYAQDLIERWQEFLGEE